MANLIDSTVLRCKLDELKALDPDEHATTVRLWPKTLAHLDAPDDEKVLDNMTAGMLRGALEHELDILIAQRRAQ